MSIHVDVASPGMTLIRINGVQVCHIVHVIQVCSRLRFTNYCDGLGETLGAEMAFFLASVALDQVSPFPLLRKAMEESSDGGGDL